MARYLRFPATGARFDSSRGEQVIQMSELGVNISAGSRGRPSP